MGNRVLFISGASSDIGSSLINGIETEYDYIIAQYYSSKGKINRLSELYGDKIIPVQADYGDSCSIKEMLKTINEMGVTPNHIVHLSAEKFRYLKFNKSDIMDFKREMQVSFFSLVEILENFLPRLKNGGKVVVMLTAYIGSNQPKFMSHYISAKYAMLGLLKSLSGEYAKKGIQINGVSPDMIETAFLENIPSMIVEQNAQNSPTGHNLKVEDVIPTIKFLLSKGADGITGSNIFVTGGIKI